MTIISIAALVNVLRGDLARHDDNLADQDDPDPHTGRDLTGAGLTATWDPALTPAMQQHGLSIAEEAVAASLLPDLRL